MSNGKYLVRLLVVVFLIGMSPHALPDETKSHVLIADRDESGLVYTLDGSVPEENEGLLLALSRVRSADPDPDSEIDILVHEQAKLSDIYNLVGMVIKVDFARYRVFVFDSDKRSMTEIQFSTPVKFLSDGNIGP